MSKQRKRKAKHRPAGLSRHGKTGPAIAVGATLLLLVVLAASGLWHSKRAASALESVSAASPPASAPADKLAAQPSSFATLLGQWVRTDGGYRLEIKSIGMDGRMEAAYLNPQPIHVAEAQASHDGHVMRVFVKLQDVNYPGSTYRLTYDPETGVLQGVYYQALLRQSFAVVFVRSS